MTPIKISYFSRKQAQFSSSNKPFESSVSLTALTSISNQIKAKQNKTIFLWFHFYWMMFSVVCCAWINLIKLIQEVNMKKLWSYKIIKYKSQKICRQVKKKRIFPNNKNNIHENFMFEEQKEMIIKIKWQNHKNIVRRNNNNAKLQAVS